MLADGGASPHYIHVLVYTTTRRVCFDFVTTNVQVEIQCNRIETVSRAAVLPFEIIDAAHRYIRETVNYVTTKSCR